MRYGTVDKDFAIRMATMDPAVDGPALMVNFMKYRERAEYADAALADDITGREADDRYAPTDVLRDIGARIVYVGDVVGVDGGPDPSWDRVAIVRYPTRRSFVEMQSRKDFRDKHVHKEAGMEFTINMTAIPTAHQGLADVGSPLVVRFDAYQVGSNATAPQRGSLWEVEGAILGDERKWAHLAVHFDPAAPAPANAMSVVTTPSINHLRDVVLEW